MKKFSSYIAISILIILLTFNSCTEKFLEVEPTGKTTESGFYKTDEDAFMSLIAAYDVLQMYTLASFDAPYLTRVLPSDESNAGGGDESDLRWFQEFDNYTYTSTNMAIKRAYEVFFYGVYRSNLVIDNIDGSSDYRKQIIAEAKVLRAFYYFELVTMFGGVPLHESVPGANDYAKARSTQDDIYAFIENNLIEAIPFLANKSKLGINDKFRASVETAEALLGKAYLYQEKWEQASIIFDALLAKEGAEVGLEPDFSNLWTPEGEWGLENLLSISFTSNENHTDVNEFWWESNRRKVESNLDVVLMGPRDGFFDLGTSGLLLGWGFNSPRKKLFDTYLDAGDEIRRKATLMSEEELINDYGGSVTPGAHGYEGVLRLKYGTFENQTTNNAADILNFGNNFYLIRYADVLLMAAEAYYRNGKEQEAQNALNKVRQRVNLVASTASGKDLFDAIVLERKLELAFEGQRFFDLVRWGLADDVLGVDGFLSGKHELFPIPQEEIDANPKISPADQNIGW